MVRTAAILSTSACIHFNSFALRNGSIFTLHYSNLSVLLCVFLFHSEPVFLSGVAAALMTLAVFFTHQKDASYHPIFFSISQFQTPSRTNTTTTHFPSMCNLALEYHNRWQDLSIVSYFGKSYLYLTTEFSLLVNIFMILYYFLTIVLSKQYYHICY